ncbi:MAG: tetratricopeptide repeat protein [Bacteroidota bacterium]
MKFFFGTFILVLISFAMNAQSVADAKQLIYHGRYKSAETMLHEILQVQADNAEAWYMLGQAYLAQDKTRALKDTLVKAPGTVSSQRLIKSLYGHVLLKENNAAEAASYFDMVLKDSKMKDAAVLAEIASAQIDSKPGNANYAIELLQNAVKRDKKNPSLYVLMGDAYRKLIDGGNAFKSYQQALTINPLYAAADYKIGKIYTSQNNAESYLEYFNKAVAADTQYAPALYELYYHYYFRDIKLSEDYLNKYIAASDNDIKNDYLETDMLYATKNYDQAIQNAENLIKMEGDNVQPRIYKLAAYSFQEKGNTDKAGDYMRTYFKVQQDTGLIAKDFEAMGDMYNETAGKADSAVYYYSRGARLEKDTSAKIVYYKKIADLYKKIKDYNNEALWLGKYYNGKSSATNVDLFNWGLANYLGKNYPAADTVFGLYEQKFPTEEFGFYWSARVNAAIDTSMENGLAVPHYLKLVELLEKDTTGKATVKKHLIESYGYLAAYKANTEKDFAGALSYFEKLLSIDPNNADAARYTTILKKNMAKSTSNETSKTSNETQKADN